MVSTIELVGIALIIFGIVYTFLKAWGTFSNKLEEKDEIESKMFTLKGSPGLILVGLGVFLLIIGAIQNSPTPSPSNDITPITIKTLSSYMTATITPEAFTTIAMMPTKKITYTFLNGKWINRNGTYSFTFDSSGSFQSKNISGDASRWRTFTGSYTINESTIILKFDNGDHYSYPIAYIDNNTFKLDYYLDFIRINSNIPTKKITYTFLNGKWINSKGTFSFTFDSSGSFQSTNMTGDASSWRSSTGSYFLTEFTIILKFDNGDQFSYPITYIDDNTFELGEYGKYYRNV